MNILVVNWTWYPSGGDWTYVENILKVYKQKGHNVIPFSMKDDRNFPSDYSDYFIENIDYKKVKKQSLTTGLKVVMKSIYSFEAQKKLKKLLDNVKIDFVHLNVIHHYITPTILKILKEKTYLLSGHYMSTRRFAQTAYLLAMTRYVKNVLAGHSIIASPIRVKKIPIWQARLLL